MWHLLPVIVASVALAQEPGGTDPTTALVASESTDISDQVGPPGPPPTPEVAAAETLRIARGLRCPVCQGQSVGESPSETAITMRLRVKELVEAGYSEDQIERYFIGRYGEWVLLDPPQRGLTQVLFVGPAVALVVVIAGLFAWRAVSARGGATVAPPAPVAPPDDPYVKRLLDEVERS
jgi:cytochrome c-type biogenesis protein CcmH/NrfF